MRYIVFLLLIGANLVPAADTGRKYNLPPPDPKGQVSNPAKLIPKPADKNLQAPAGFTVEEYASGFQKPRGIAQLPGGQVIVTEGVPRGGVYLVEEGKRGKALVDGLDRPYGILVHKGYLYVSEAEAIKRYKLDAKALSLGAAEVIVPLKGYGKPGGHWTRSLAIQGERLYVSVGSGSNVDLGDPEDRAAVNVYNLDGSGHEIFATGLRNPVCIRFQPQSKKLWTTVQERDGLGDEVAQDFFTSLEKGAFYGWPYAYDGPNEEPRHAGKNPEAVKKTVEPDILLGPHVSAMDFAFYTGKQFPEKYRNGAFIAFRGSSGRTKRIGYSIMFVPFKGGKPVGQPEPFVTGWMLGEDVKEVWGRPVGVAQMSDGSLLVSEDGNNKLFKVTYKK
jgi:glucose/arabinose dehydrogenase